MRSIILAFAFALIIFGFSTHGQSDGVIQGVVKDPNGGKIVKATVFVESNSDRWTLFTDDQGSYKARLPDGKYRVRAQMDGFSPSGIRRVKIRNGTNSEVSFTLKGIRNDSRHP